MAYKSAYKTLPRTEAARRLRERSRHETQAWLRLKVLRSTDTGRGRKRLLARLHSLIAAPAAAGGGGNYSGHPPLRAASR
jgi:hypothetical protein